MPGLRAQVAVAFHVAGAPVKAFADGMPLDGEVVGDWLHVNVRSALRRRRWRRGSVSGVSVACEGKFVNVSGATWNSTPVILLTSRASYCG